MTTTSTLALLVQIASAIATAVAVAVAAHGLISRARIKAGGLTAPRAILIKHVAVTSLPKNGEMVLSLPRQTEGLALNAVADDRDSCGVVDNA